MSFWSQRKRSSSRLKNGEKNEDIFEMQMALKLSEGYYASFIVKNCQLKLHWDTLPTRLVKIQVIMHCHGKVWENRYSSTLWWEYGWYNPYQFINSLSIFQVHISLGQRFPLLGIYHACIHVKWHMHSFSVVVLFMTATYWKQTVGRIYISMQCHTTIIITKNDKILYILEWQDLPGCTF